MKKKYGTFKSFDDIHPETLIGMGKTLQKIEDGKLGCTMCGWYLDKVNGDFDHCGKCGFKFNFGR